MKKNYIAPQSETVSFFQITALCASGDTTPTPTTITFGGSTSEGDGTPVTEGY